MNARQRVAVQAAIVPDPASAGDGPIDSTRKDKEVVVRRPGEVDDPPPPRQSPNLWSAASEKLGKLIGGGDASELTGGGSGGGGDEVVRRPEDSDSEEHSNPLAVIWRKMSGDIDSLNFPQVVFLCTAVASTTWKVAKFNNTLVTRAVLEDELKPIKHGLTKIENILYVGALMICGPVYRIVK